MGRTAGYDTDSVLEASMALFWARGYRNTSLKHLESALDMRPGSIYAAFGSKELLFHAALERYAQGSRMVLTDTLAGAASPLAGLATYVRMLGSVMRTTDPSRACMLVKTLLETQEEDPKLRHSVEVMMQKAETAFAEAFTAARDAGEIPQGVDPKRLAARLQAAIFGLRCYAQRSDAAERVERLAEDIALDVEALRC